MTGARSRILWAVAAATAAIGGAILVAGLRAPPEPEPAVGDLGRRRVSGPRVRVEVLNAGGTRGVAGDATELLRDAGFDVVSFGNAQDIGADSSVVLDRVGRHETAGAVADALGIHNVRSEPDSNLYVDVSVLLGSEWRRPDPAQTDEPERPAWWDPRGWLRR